MSRSGYSDDCANVGLWRGAVHRATTGYRGQHLLRKLRDALDAMPVRRLITDAIKDDSGAVCALGALDPTVTSYDAEDLADHFGIARALAAEIVYENDEHDAYGRYALAAPTAEHPYGEWVLLPRETPEERWTRMRAWVAQQIVPREDEHQAAVAVDPHADRTGNPTTRD